MENRIGKFLVPNEIPTLVSEMIRKLTLCGVDAMEARKRAMQALVDALVSVVHEDPLGQDGAREFVVLVGYNTPKDPKIKILHSCWLESNHATDSARAYGILSAFAQYWGTSLITKHVNPDDLERAFGDFFRNIEAHVQQLREHERQEKLGADGGG